MNPKDDVVRLQLILKKEMQRLADLYYQMDLIMSEYDLCVIQGKNERSEMVRIKYHDTVDMFLDHRSVIATLTREIENLK